MDSKQAVLDRYQEIKSVCESFDAHCIAISKKQDNEKIEWLYEDGHREFGESYIQEWETKKEVLPKDIKWHFVGQIQSRKVKPLCEQGVFSIHSLGSESSLKKWSGVEHKPSGPCFLQLNLEGEIQKGGLSLEEVTEMREAGYLEHINGLMTIPPKALSEQELAEHFKKMRKLCDEFAYENLSMGMSSDWKLALEEGATHVRVGTGLFGERPY